MGPSHPFLLRLSPVRMALCASVQMNMLIFEMDLYFQTSFHRDRLGGAFRVSLESL
jgi:hypothetical protein